MSQYLAKVIKVNKVEAIQISTHNIHVHVERNSIYLDTPLSITTIS